MEVEDFKKYTSHCFQGSHAPCMAVCPLRVDVRALIDKIQKGNFSAAYRLFRNQVLFPRIVSMICHQPCQEVCIRKSVDIAIQVRLIEQACVKFTKNKAPIVYNVPQKNSKVAIIGAGLSGMACALKLSSRNYDVTIYEKQAVLGGQLKDLLPQDLYISEFENEFKAVSYKLMTYKEIVNIGDIHADSIYIATGAGGPFFDLLDGMDENSLGTVKKGIFLGGSIIGANPIEAIEHGIRASFSIEKYLKVGLMDGVPESYQQRAVEPNYYKLPVSITDFPKYTCDEISEDHAVVESHRCLKCDCGLCYNVCDLMKRFKRNPKQIIREVMASLRPVENFSKRVANRLINTCNQCGLCTTVCPEGIDMENCLLQARRFLHKDGAIPPSFHEFWLNDMEFANSEKAYVFITPEIGLDSKYMFFPGCQLGASDPNYVVKTYEYLKKIYNQIHLLVGCCGVPADWAGSEELRDRVLKNILENWDKSGKPTVILACPTCIKTFSSYLPQIKTISLFSVLAEHSHTYSLKEKTDDIISVFDPCASRYHPKIQMSVRKLLTDAGFKIEELTHTGKIARCCSYGGHIKAANLEQAKSITEDRINEKSNPYITYCSNCRDTFASEGKPCAHILDIFFNLNAMKRPAPNLSQRRINRVALAKELKREQKIVKINDACKLHSSLDIPKKVEKYMNDHLILEEDVVSVIEHFEKTGNVLQNKSTGELIGHLRRGEATYWVAYKKKGSGYILSKVYFHRMKIEGNN